MNWLNINLRTLRSPEYIGSDPTERATWLQLLAYCADQENGGRIIGGASWKDRQWQQTCGVTLREVTKAQRLLMIGDGDVVVNFYPTDKETEVKAKRKAGIERAEKRWNTEETPDNRHSSAISSASSLSDASANSSLNAERNEKEKGIGKEIIPPTPKGVNGNGKKLPESKEAQQINSLYHRKSGWGEKEIRAFKKLLPIDAAELELVCIYTEAQRKLGDEGRHRRDLCTFLNNYRGEVDRAQQWKSKPRKAESEFYG